MVLNLIKRIVKFLNFTPATTGLLKYKTETLKIAFIKYIYILSLYFSSLNEILYLVPLFL